MSRAWRGAYRVRLRTEWRWYGRIELAPVLTRKLANSGGTLLSTCLANPARCTARRWRLHADHRMPGQDEDAELLPALDAEVLADMSLYGQAKVACERHVLDTFGATRSLIARVGLIGGPGDEFDRSGYWPLRFARAAELGRDVLAPDTPQAPTQIIDVRDLAAWVVRCAERGACGTYNVTGETTTFEHFVDIAKRAAGSRGTVVAASSEWLLDQQVAPWMGPRSLPLWLPMDSHSGFSARDSSKASRAGLVRRPLEHTLRDTLAWEVSRNPSPSRRRAGLSDDEEADLLRLHSA